MITSMLVLMIRYLDLLTAEVERMRMARISRGDAPRALHQIGAIARGVGALFLRSFERGERVYVAMLSRGFDGRHRSRRRRRSCPASPALWAAAMAPAVTAVGVCATAWVTA